MASVKLSHLYFKHCLLCVEFICEVSVFMCVCMSMGGCVLVGTYVSHQLNKLYSSVVSIYM